MSLSKYNTVDVLGCGPGIANYHNNGKNYKVGVNDVWKHFTTDVLVLVDHPESFSPERRATIEQSRPQYFMSTLDSWRNMHNFRKLYLASEPGEVATLEDITALPFHVDSTFTAVSLAYHFSMKSVVLWGVDFYGSPLMEHEDKILTCYSNLFNKMASLGIGLYVGYENSLLSKILPVYSHQLQTI